MRTRETPRRKSEKARRRKHEIPSFYAAGCSVVALRCRFRAGACHAKTICGEVRGADVVRFTEDPGRGVDGQDNRGPATTPVGYGQGRADHVARYIARERD